ncbi:MAG: hypothetical protein GXO63_03225 [Candidatus Micrarchaeota archaeon]|nr:hypothetical protein [Candidatus Micrarchaeota archaeon]
MGLPRRARKLLERTWPHVPSNSVLVGSFAACMYGANHLPEDVDVVVNYVPHGYEPDYLVYTERKTAGHNITEERKYIPYTVYRNGIIDVFVGSIVCIKPDKPKRVDGYSVLRRYDVLATMLFPSAITEERVKMILPVYAGASSNELDAAEKKILDGSQEFFETLPEESKRFLTKREFEEDLKKTRNKISYNTWFSKRFLRRPRAPELKEYLEGVYEELVRAI